MKDIKAGQFLYATCSATYYEILRVEKDINGQDSLDLKVDNINDFLWTEREGFDQDYCQLEIVPCGPVVFKNLGYKIRFEDPDGDLHVNCNTPGSGCHRCTCAFIVRDKKD